MDKQVVLQAATFIFNTKYNLNARRLFYYVFLSLLIRGRRHLCSSVLKNGRTLSIPPHVLWRAQRSFTMPEKAKGHRSFPSSARRLFDAVVWTSQTNHNQAVR
jgi:hypothetical protein